MLVIQLKNLLSDIPDNANVLIYSTLHDGARQLLFSDIDITKDKDIVIDAEYKIPVKHTTIDLTMEK